LVDIGISTIRIIRSMMINSYLLMVKIRRRLEYIFKSGLLLGHQILSTSFDMANP